MPDNHIQAYFCFIAVATTLYFGHLVTAQSGTNTLSLAYKATNLCTAIEKKPELHQKDYEACLHSYLEPIVWSLIENNDLDLKNCKADKKKESKKVWCSVIVDYWPRYILITDEILVEYIKDPRSNNKPSMPRHVKELPPIQKIPSVNDFVKMSKESDNTVGVPMNAHKPLNKIPGQIKKQPQTQKMPSVNEFIKYKVQENVVNPINDLKQKAEDKMDDVKLDAKLHTERVNRLADDFKGRVAETGKYAAASMIELGKNLKATWNRPLKKA